MQRRGFLASLAALFASRVVPPAAAVAPTEHVIIPGMPGHRISLDGCAISDDGLSGWCSYAYYYAGEQLHAGEAVMLGPDGLAYRA